MTSFASYFSSLSLENENNSLLKYRKIWTGFHFVVHSGGESEVGAEVESKAKAKTNAKSPIVLGEEETMVTVATADEAKRKELVLELRLENRKS